jgi:hypothetical protein
MSKLQDRRRALPEVIAITSNEIGRIDAEEHRPDGVDSDAENEIVEV